MPHFSDNTSKQINDKRYLLGLTKTADGQATPGRVTAIPRSLDGTTQKLPLDSTMNTILRPQVNLSKAKLETMHANFGYKNLCQTSAKSGKDAAIDSLAVEASSIANALSTAEDVSSASELYKPELDTIVDELTVILSGDKPFPSSNSRRVRNGHYGLLATMVAEDTLVDTDKQRQPELPKDDQVRDLYEQLWGVTGTTLPSVWEQTVQARAGVVDINPIQLGIVESRYKRLKPRRATGADGVDKDIRPTVRIFLTIFYNILLGIGFYPTVWKRNRTTLILKDGNDVTAAANWRPITVSSILARLFSGVLDECLRGNVELNRTQKGCVKVNEGRQWRDLFHPRHLQGLLIPHDAIVPTLRRLGVTHYIADYVRNGYQDCPRSPFLWNAVVDPALGMTLSIAKRSAFNIKPLHKIWAVTSPYLNVDRQEVGYVEPDEALRYLRVSFTSWKYTE
nr:unnamed protein product [Callosobruchus analis]